MVRHRLVAMGSLALLVVAAAAFGADTYEGLASVGGFDQFPRGMYGATRLVGPYSVVSVRNLETGRTARITITDREPTSGTFLLVAPAAAEWLGIPFGDEARVALTEVPIGARAAGTFDDSAWPFDPDINPRIRMYPRHPDPGARAHMAENATLTIEPAEPGPPVSRREDPAQGAAQTAAVPSSPNLPIVDSLDAPRYYLQVGSYASRRTVQRVVDSIGTVYPVVVLPVDREDQTMYQVLVGPLVRDETGAIRLWLRANGYPDVIVRGGARR